MPVDSAAYLSAVSIMLGAYGFFYGLYRDRIQAALDTGPAKANPEKYTKQVEEVEGARSTALLLGIVPLAIWLIFLGPVVEEIEAGFNVDFALSQYSAIDVAFCLAASAWGVIAVIVFLQFFRLRATVQRLDNDKPQ